jgi:acyl-[acyl carrier protein]--UDP-N-acetylglucosamine O-acyltransferase
MVYGIISQEERNGGLLAGNVNIHGMKKFQSKNAVHLFVHVVILKMFGQLLHLKMLIPPPWEYEIFIDCIE